MTLSLIAAVDQRGAIGYRNHLLFHLAEDLHHFKALTLGHTIIMGRKTYDSLPHGALPQRRNIVLSKQLKHLKDAECYASIEAALAECQTDDEVFVIGGAEVYHAFLPLAHRLYLTEVNAEAMEADAFFPSFDKEKWLLKNLSFPQKPSAIGFCFAEYHRR